MSDITNQIQFADTPPQDAVKNIDDARLFNMGADEYKDHKPFLQSEADLLKTNTTVTRGVAEYSATSSQHSSLIKKDTVKLSQAETLFTQGKERVDGTDLNKKINDLKLKQTAKPNEFTEDDAVSLFMMEDDLKTRKEFKVDKPGKNDKLVNKYFEKTKEISTLESMFASYGSTLFSTLAGVSQIPTLAYDAYYYPANLIRRFNGEPEITTPEVLTKNPVYQTFTQIAKDLNAMAPDMNKDVTDSIASGDFVEAGRIAAIKMSGQIPQLTTTLISTMLGGPLAAMATVGATTAPQYNIENKEKGFTPTQALPNALAKSTAEMAFERIGTIAAFKRLESSLTYSFGKDNAAKVIFNMGKSLLGAGGQEFTEEAATSLAQDFTDVVSGVDPSKIEGFVGRSLEAGTMGFLMGGSMVAPAAGLKAYSNIQQYGQVQDNKRKAVDFLNFDSDVTKALELVKETEMAKLSQAETAQFLKTIFKGIGFNEVYLDKESLQAWANSPEKATAIRNIINPTGEAAAALNAPIKVPAHEFFALTFEFPDIQEQYKLTPEGASIKQAGEYLESINEATDKKQKVLSKLEAPEQTPEDIQMIQEALNPEQPNETDILNEDSYLDSTRMVEALSKILPKTEVDAIVEAQTKAKQGVVDNINDTAQYEMEQVIDVGVQEAMDVEREAQLKQLETSPNLDIVDKFTSYPDIDGVSFLHKKKGFSAVAIDPSTVPIQYQDFLTDEQLKKHKVFVEGGVSLEESATLLGVSSGIELLRILSKTPTRQEVVDQRVQDARLDIENETKAQVGLNEVGISKAINARLENAVATMTTMRTKFWSATKKGFKGIVITPSTKKFMSDARNAIVKSKVGDLNANQFKVGERKSERMAWNAVSKNEIEKAYVNQEAVAKNIALQAQTHFYTAKVNRVIKLARKFNKASTIQELRDAGPTYLDAAQEILESFNLTTKKSNKTEKDSFKKWSEKVAKEGQGNYTIPERLMDQRESLGDMTVEQVLAAGTALQAILHMAKFKNKLFKKHKNIKGLQTLEAIGNLVEENAKKVFDYNMEKSKIRQDSQVTPIQGKIEVLMGLKTYLERTQFLIRKLDDGKAVGFFNDLFWRPLVDASNDKKTLIDQTRVQLEKIFDAFGREEFDNLSNDMVFVEEFVGKQTFTSGNVSKADLLSMELNFGNEGNIVELEKYGLTRDQLRAILDKHLTDKHTALAQNIWNMYESFKPKMQELQKRTEGADNVIWVEAKPFVARGKEYPGGYYPIVRLSDKAKIMARKAEGVGVMSALDKFKLNYYGDAMTEQGHLESRTGNDDFIDLNLNAMAYSMNQIIHDLTHREVIADGVKLLSDKKIRDNISAVIGKDGYSNIVSTYISTAQEVENDSYGESPLLKAINKFANGFQIVAIGANLTSVAIQPLAIGVALNTMGKSSVPIFLKNVQTVFNHPELIYSMYKFAEELNPAIRSFTEDISKNSSSALTKQIPTKDSLLTPLDGTREFITTTAFMALSEVDRINKVLVTLTAYQQAIEGKVEGLENLKGDHEGASKYASNMSELTQTHNDIRNLPPAQKNKYMKMFLFFYNDLNNLYNNTIGVSREVRKEFKKGNKWAATAGVASFMLVLSAMKLYETAIRAQPLPGDDDEEKGAANLTKAWAKFLLWSPIDSVGSTLPVIRDMKFAAGKKWEKRKIVQLPFEVAMTEIVTATTGLYDYLSLIEEGKDLTTQEQRALWMSAGILFRLPTGAIYNTFIREPNDRDYLKVGVLDRLNSIVKKTVNNPDVSEKFKKDLQDLDARLNPKAVEIPKQTYSTLKEMISESNPTAYNEDTGAAGIYQFTEEVWNNLMMDAPQLALTENGRVSQKTEQQERAFEYTSKQSGEILRASGFQTTPENIYGSHILGPLKLVEVLSAQDGTRINTLVDTKVLKAYGVDSDVTVGGFKDWLLFKVVEAEERLTNESNK